MVGSNLDVTESSKRGTENVTEKEAMNDGAVSYFPWGGGVAQGVQTRNLEPGRKASEEWISLSLSLPYHHHHSRDHHTDTGRQADVCVREKARDVARHTQKGWGGGGVVSDWAERASMWVSSLFLFRDFCFFEPNPASPFPFLLLINGRTLPFTMPCMQMQVY